MEVQNTYRGSDASVNIFEQLKQHINVIIQDFDHLAHVKYGAYQLIGDLTDSMDPRIVKEAHVISELSFGEAAELATFGAKVLRPASLWPAIRCNIPIFVGSSLEPHLGGTWMRKELNMPLPTLRAVALRKNQSLLTVHCLDMFHAEGFLANVFHVLAKHHIQC